MTNVHITKRHEGDAPKGVDDLANDIANAHAQLLPIRGSVAKIFTDQGQVRNVLAISIISAGEALEDQMVVYTPGANTERNARGVAKALRASAAQIENNIKKGVYS